MQGKALDNEIQSFLTVRRDELKKESEAYLGKHKELMELLNDFLSSLLLQKPDDIYIFSRDYFNAFNPNPTLFKPMVISGPSGVGKGALITNLLKEFPSIFATSVSYTTRAPRAGEEHGKHYYFISDEEFKNMIKENKFIEYCHVHTASYGTAKAEVERIIKEKKICILEIDVQGAQKVNKASIDANYMFLYPPSPEELKERIIKRGTEDEDEIKLRLENGLKEIEFANKTILFKYKIINDKFEPSYIEFKELLLRIYKQECQIIAEASKSKK